MVGVPRYLVHLSLPPAVAAATMVGTASAHAAAAYQGSAVALTVRVDLAGATILDQVLPGAVAFPDGGAGNVVALPQSMSELATLKILDVSSGLTGGGLASTAATTMLSVLNGLVGADVLTAECTARNRRVEGASQVSGLLVAGAKVPVDPGPNVKVGLPAELTQLGIAGEITLNEREDLNNRAFAVRALHLRLHIDPAALAHAVLGPTAKHLRDLAEQVTTAIEQATGERLDALTAQEDRRRSPAPTHQPAAAAPEARTAAADSDPARAERAASAEPIPQPTRLPGADTGEPKTTTPRTSERTSPAPRSAAGPMVRTGPDDAPTRKRPTGAPAAAARAGVLGIDVVVSQVSCRGASAPAAAKPAVPARPAPVAELPKTGGNAASAGIGIAGVAMLATGSVAVYLTRRRGRHAR